MRCGPGDAAAAELAAAAHELRHGGIASRHLRRHVKDGRHRLLHDTSVLHFWIQCRVRDSVAGLVPRRFRRLGADTWLSAGDGW